MVRPPVEIVLARTLGQFMQVRKVRNQCRNYMTRNQRYIDPIQQVRFWLRVRNAPHVKVFVIYVGADAVGYAILNGHMITGGLVPGYRGLGMGRALFTHLTRLVPKPGLLEVLDSNKPARRLYESLGWKEYKREGHVISMRYQEELKSRGFAPSP